ncbi:MAG TPA: rod shape-determining protein RodA [Bacteroidales bacterium]|nr:rod shape-determining protein RodA [Bacteroidales bacterium]
MERRRNILINLDWLSILAWMALVMFGLINVYSANIMNGNGDFFDFTQRYGKQFLWVVASIVLIAIIFLLDAKFFAFFGYVLYGLIIVILISVLIFGKEINGAKSWFAIGGFQFQPSEFAKPFTALALARLISSHGFVLKKFKSILWCGIIIFTPAVLIMLQPDMGSSMVFFSFIFVLYREGFSQNMMILGATLVVLFIVTLLIDKLIILIAIWALSLVLIKFISIPNKITFLLFSVGLFSFGLFYLLKVIFNLNMLEYHVALIGIAGTLVVAPFISYNLRSGGFNKVIIGMVIAVAFVLSVDYAMNNILQEHQRQRIYVTLGMEDDPQGVGYNVNQSKIAIGSGGFSGKGFLNGTQTKLQFVPEQSTDFIFCTVGEEWGFTGTTIVVIIFVFLLIRLVILAERQRSHFSRIFGYGFISVLLVHFTVNIGMTIGLFPVIGIPLPFFSYGGSSMLAFSIFLFIFLKLDSNRKALLR